MPDINILSNIQLNSSCAGRPPLSCGRDEAKLKKACSGLESVFVYYLIKEMRAAIPKSGLLNRGKGEEIYTSMLDSQLAKELSSKGTIGLSSVLFNQLKDRSQGVDAQDTKK